MRARRSPSATLVAFTLEHSLLLPLGAVCALVWANVATDSYDRVAHALAFAVNDIGMVFFFALAAKEIVEAMLPNGPLSSPRRAAAPLIAAVGGMAVPAALYCGLAVAVAAPDLMRGWAIPCATDIAFSYLVARLIFGRGHPAVPFLLLLAIADDALGLAILAVFYPQAELRLVPAAVLVAIALATAWWFRRRRVYVLWPYVLVSGSLSWLGLYWGGFHPALALVPIVPFIPHARAEVGMFVPAEASRSDPLGRFEHWWATPVQATLLLFGFVNAGVPVSAVGAGTWIVLAAILVGKPLGIVLFSAAASVIGVRRPPGLSWGDLATVGCAAGIGFTVALFFATAAFAPGPLQDQTKMGAVLSIAGAGLAWVAGSLRSRTAARV